MGLIWAALWAVGVLPFAINEAPSQAPLGESREALD